MIGRILLLFLFVVIGFGLGPTLTIASINEVAGREVIRFTVWSWAAVLWLLIVAGSIAQRARPEKK